MHWGALGSQPPSTALEGAGGGGVVIARAYILHIKGAVAISFSYLNIKK